MAVANTVTTRYLERRDVPFELIAHRPVGSSAAAAAVAHVPAERLAKGVLVEDDRQYLLVVIPAAHRLELGVLHQRLGRQCGLATEAEVVRLFPDGEAGAVPSLGQAYGLHVLVDDALLDGGDVYLEAGDRRHLVRLAGADFERLMRDAGRGRFSEGARRGPAHAP